MTGLATLPQAMLYIPLKEAAIHATMSAITMVFIGLGYSFALLSLGIALGINPYDYPNPTQTCKWRNPYYLSLAALGTGCMFYLNANTLSK